MKTTRWIREMPLHMLLLPGLILVLVYSYVPMLGVVIAFQKFTIFSGWFGSPWIGLDNFRFVLDMPNTGQVIWNTIFIACMKIVFGLFVPIVVALLLNEVSRSFIKRGVQTLIYLPHFLSWVILGGILIDLLSPSEGIVNAMLGKLGFEPIFFLADNRWFPAVLIASDVWKEFGFSTIVYLAAITSVNPTLYEAAVVDGANRWKQTFHVTLPGMMPIIVLMVTLSLGNVLNAGFDQVFNLANPLVYESGDILDTMIYRIAFNDAQYGVATAVGLFKSVVSFLLISVSYWLAYRLANYRIF
ncbi:ABC transporter permease [Cohnella phaseoli]|uniref:Putative aldouronate transport system permease protein n=1 Tax=Cohnella phaseoli TaxID=456490 RepID=A0A3D9KH71_9BACL|nr:ABC transporter permease subunit [Cohnella phaseoli]RED85512.1 putative aldouronate transport system permease protein [Cohnella phaseoli]